ncbi:MAG: glycosyl transferase family 1 [Acidobacteria bacterium]|nr:MAG: glycosyl transferase family 1 [Acidobacteriota bacterium]
MTKRRLLTIGHSYVVALNRRLASEMARVDDAQWDVTVAAPEFVQGDLRPIPFESANDAARVRVVGYRGASPHLMAYSGLSGLLSQDWDLVHCWEEPYGLAAAQIALMTPRRPLLVMVSAQNIAKTYPPPFSLFERFSMSRAAGWICFGESSRQVLNGKPMYAARPQRIIAMGVDTDAFHPDSAAGARVRATLGWQQPGPPVVGYLGRFVEEKGIRDLCRALDVQRHGSWRTLFVGDGPLFEDLRSWAARHDDRVRVVTGIPHDEVPAYLNAMDILCAPSITTPRWREQFGRMLVEAFACGVAVVASDSGEIPHVVADAAMVVPEGDVAALASAVAALCDSDERRRDLGRRGRARACRLFAWDVIAREHLEFFDELVRDRAHARTAYASALAGRA